MIIYDDDEDDIIMKKERKLWKLHKYISLCWNFLEKS